MISGPHLTHTDSGPTTMNPRTKPRNIAKVLAFAVIGLVTMNCASGSCTTTEVEKEAITHRTDLTFDQHDDTYDWLFLRSYDPREKSVIDLPLYIGDDPTSVELFSPLTHTAIHVTPSLQITSPAAHFGPTLVIGEPIDDDDNTDEEDRRFRILFRRADNEDSNKPTRIIDLDDTEPTALHLVADALYLGAGPRLLWFDLTSDDPSPQELAHRSGFQHKPYDLFAGTDDHLVAIDDEVAPFFADLLSLDERGHPTHRADWTLPSLVNGGYTDAALVDGPGAMDYKLLMLSNYGVLDSSGQHISALPIRGTQLGANPDMVLPGSAGGISVLHEEVFGDADRPPSLAAGKEYTRWQGIAVSTEAQRLFVAAESRGLISFPFPFSSGDEGTLHDLGGDCLDVKVTPRGIFALVETSTTQTELVVLQWDDDSLQIIARHPLEGRYADFVPGQSTTVPSQ